MTLQWKLLRGAKIKVKSFKTHLTDPEVLPSTLDRMRRNKEEAVKPHIMESTSASSEGSFFYIL